MGKPEEIFEEEETEEEKENAKKRVFQEQVITGKKKLMRDPDNRVIGGVAAGIAAYMGWDATAVRLAMILLLFIPVRALDGSAVHYTLDGYASSKNSSRPSDHARKECHTRNDWTNSHRWFRKGIQ